MCFRCCYHKTLGHPSHLVQTCLALPTWHDPESPGKQSKWWLSPSVLPVGMAGLDSLLFDGGRPSWCGQFISWLHYSEDSWLKPARVCLCPLCAWSWVWWAAWVPALTSPKWWAVTWHCKPSKPFPPPKLVIFCRGEGNETGIEGEGKAGDVCCTRPCHFLKALLSTVAVRTAACLGQHSSLSLRCFDPCGMRISFKSKVLTFKNHFSNSVDDSVSG